MSTVDKGRSKGLTNFMHLINDTIIAKDEFLLDMNKCFKTKNNIFLSNEAEKIGQKFTFDGF